MILPKTPLDYLHFNRMAVKIQIRPAQPYPEEDITFWVELPGWDAKKKCEVPCLTEVRLCKELFATFTKTPLIMRVSPVDHAALEKDKRLRVMLMVGDTMAATRVKESK